ncbi:hypothetical protein DACRYDRAFT_62612 [Dacryopinax primogenitus]|uniref:Clavaminate synthase-like protein n=1 Tax=Dacryopinax primogenitus (strain DJM 731) TaxID=1858805 RepID=M5GAK9_DACPD|nr:uncharacterized protein DACRYDRAFT_62612 [Dacryopinax primogenitus]EJU05894.1 hypothetical protein DACRYDRAFT_62612 [Dacryopinax primogenitus]
MAPKQYQVLTQADVDHFLEHGWVKIPGALLPEWSEKFTQDVWIRLGMNPEDKSTWTRDRANMPWHQAEKASVVAPRAWGAICDLLGGEERVSDTSYEWRDSLIVNLGKEEYKDMDVNPRELDNWHVDGDWFLHFLDSPEQALLVIPLFADIKPKAGATYISPDGIQHAAKYLLDHAEGTYPASGGGFAFKNLIPKCNEFVECCGNKGDVFILHPLMLHSASKNHLRIPRLITNPAVSIKEPFNFNRENPDDFSLVELKTLKALGLDRLDYKITRDRQRIRPLRMDFWEPQLQVELDRLRAHAAKTGKPVRSAHANGVVFLDDHGAKEENKLEHAPMPDAAQIAALKAIFAN